MKAPGFWSDLGRGFIDLLFPPASVCAVCGRDATGTHLRFCAQCLGRLTLIAPPICPRCGRMQRLDAVKDGSCRECSRENFFFTAARAVCLYDGAVRSYLHEVKFRRSLALAGAFADLLGVHVREEAAFFRRFDALVPVPLHADRLDRRGFNQAEVLAYSAARSMRRPLYADALARVRQTMTQSKLDRERRRENVRDAFRATRPGLLTGSRVLLVDDVFTTGYTASECARVLLRAGAVEVGVLTVANGVIEEQWQSPYTKNSNSGIAFSRLL